MRIIAGTLKGRRLVSPEGRELRPTSDKLRETLFNMLGARPVGARVLDGFAGTGALGLEAISRGADRVVFIERDPRAVGLIEQNVSRCEAGDRCAIIRADFALGLAELRNRPSFVPFDLVVLDPPYHLGPAHVLDGVDAVVAPSGLVVLEHACRVPAPERVGALRAVKERRSGDSVLTFYEREGRDG